MRLFFCRRRPVVSLGGELVNAAATTANEPEGTIDRCFN